MNRPRLSSTATSRFTVVTSLRNVGVPAGRSGFLPNSEGIFAGSACWSAPFFAGLATVSPPSRVGALLRRAGRHNQTAKQQREEPRGVSWLAAAPSIDYSRG